MPDLRLVAVSDDGSYLVLVTDEGQEHRLPIDDRLEAAVRGERSRLGQLQIDVETDLRPRDIQARIRAGQSAEQVALTAGVALEKVQRYEGPVLAERQHVAEQAQATAVRRQGEGRQGPLLGELVSERLQARGVDRDALRWDSWRREDGTWEVCLTYPAASQDQQARWVYDPQRRSLAAADAEARWLTDEEAAAPEAEPKAPARRLRSVRSKPDDVYDLDADGGLHAVESRPDVEGEEGAPASEAAATEVAASDDTARSTKPAGEPDDGEGQDRRDETAEQEPVPASRPAASASPQEADEDDEEPESTASTQGRGARKSRRAQVPSWDEIVFGSKKQK